MIKSLQLKNFERHTSRTIEFSPGITTITGPSFIGKSSILRALLWVLTNRPTGTGFIHHGAASCDVAVEADGHTVVRHRGKAVNEYLIDEGKPLEAVGASVPDGVFNALRLDPDLNIQRQFDMPYLLFLTPGEVARHFNDISGLAIIDTAFANVKSREAHITTEKKAAERLLDTAKGNVNRLAWVKVIDAQVKEAVGLVGEIKGLSEDLAGLQRLRYRREEQVQEQAEASKKAQRLDKYWGRIEAAAAEYKEVGGLLTGLIEMQTRRQMVIKNMATAGADIEAREEEEALLMAQMPKDCPFCGQRMPKGGKGI